MEELLMRKETLINDVNDTVIFHLIKERGPLARIDLVTITKLCPQQ